jgi:myo-inositol-1(or 4)-monophosphatase
MSADERIGAESRARLAADLAVLWGRLALERFHRAQSARGEGAMVSDTDLAIHDTLGREIARLFPGDGLIGDEPTWEDGARSSGRYAWVLAPLDDTGNFARGMPGFTVSVGVMRGRMPFAGAVYDPVARWLFSGCVGRGAWLNDRPLHADGDAARGTALFAARTPWAGGVPQHVERWMRRYGVRRFGSTALHLCYVALGGLDFVHDDRASLSEIAGAAPVLLEAGALLTNEAGAPLFPLASSQAATTSIALLAGHPRAHADALRDLCGPRTAALVLGADVARGLDGAA